MSRDDCHKQDERSEREVNKLSAAQRGDEAQEQGLSSAGRGRRRFSQAALASVPVLLTMHSQPLRAAASGNCDISGWHSGGSQQPQSCGDGARSPDGWNMEGIPDEHKDTLMREIFNPVYLGDPAALSTVEYIIEGKEVEEVTDKPELLRVGTAAWLNAKTERYKDVVGLSEARIKEIVDETLDNGEYATNNATLGRSEVIEFFEQTWGSGGYYL